MTKSLTLTLGMLMAAAANAQDTVDPIVGGSPVPTDTVQWLGSLQTSSSFHFCGSSLIAPDVVITAAHCVANGATNFKILFGTTDLNSNTGFEVRPQRVYVNAAYDERDISNDIALIKLTAPIPASQLEPFPYDRSNNNWQSGNGRILGWGRTGGNGNSPTKMLFADVPIVSDAVCRQVSPFDQILKTSQVCIGFRDASLGGACNGDSGGPLTVGGIQVGLTSYGARGCTTYAGYTQLNEFLPWIDARLAEMGSVPTPPTTTPPPTNEPAPPTALPTLAPEEPCACVGSGLDVGSTCGQWLNQNFNFCYSDRACPGGTASGRYPGFFWFRCQRSRFDQFQEIENAAMNYPDTENLPLESFQVVAEEASESNQGTDIAMGAGIGALVAGLVAGTVFAVQRKKSQATVDSGLTPAEYERRNTLAAKPTPPNAAYNAEEV